MTLEEFDAFRDAVLAAIPDDVDDEWWGTERHIASGMLNRARESLYGTELVEQAERDLLKKLLAKYGEEK